MFVRLHGFVRGAVQCSIDVSSPAAAVESSWSLLPVAVMMLPLAIVDALDPVDKVTIELQFGNGSIGTIHYFANGHRSFPKERLEIFCGGRILQLNNFRELRSFGWSNSKRVRSWRQDKGQNACARAFVDALREGAPSPIPYQQILEVARATFDAAEGAKSAVTILSANR